MDLQTADAIFSNNYFDLLPNQPIVVYTAKKETNPSLILEDSRRQLQINNLNSVMASAKLGTAK
ncbi:glycoside hydrolase family 2 protein [Sporolactobacillus pectinivorans]|uniref:glycoside hydrolase family 2 protein n=1 Tax=Sporolactobacillus pectinivorans TaxID=1591408 RepID=UPI0012FE7C04